MPIDIDGLSYEELLQLNHRVVERLKMLEAMQAHVDMMAFNLGARVSFDTGPEIILRQKSIVGSWTFSVLGQRECAEFCAARGLPVVKLFTHSFRLEEAREAYELFNQQTAGKAVILPN